MRAFLLFVLLPLLAALLAGCCANNTCDCQDEREDAIQLRFRTSDTISVNPSGFRLADLDTIRVVRYRLSSTATDTVVRTRRKAEAGEVLFIATDTPFDPKNPRRAGLYRYTVLLTNGSRRRPRVRQRFELREIQLQGRYEADGCCTCYDNTGKTASVLAYPAGATEPPTSAKGVNLDQVIELTRP